MPDKDKDFKTSSLQSDFGKEYCLDKPNIGSVDYSCFPKGPTVGREMADMYCAGTSEETFATFSANMLLLQYHTTEYLNSIDTANSAYVLVALRLIPDIDDIKAHVRTGKSSKWITDLYTSRMVIFKKPCG